MTRGNWVAALFIAADVACLASMVLQLLIRTEVGHAAGERRGILDFGFMRRIAQTHRAMFPASRKRIWSQAVLMLGGALLLASAIAAVPADF